MPRNLQLYGKNLLNKQVGLKKIKIIKNLIDKKFDR